MATRLKGADGLEEWSDEQYARVEKDVMVGAFMCRKLGESYKFTDSYWGQQIGVMSYPLKREPPTIMSNHRPQDFYDLDKPKPETVSFEALCNQIIHSHVFGFWLDVEAAKHYVWVASDRGRRQRLIQVSLDSFITLFVDASKNYPHRIIQTAVEGKDDYEVRSW